MTETEPRYANVYRTPRGEIYQESWGNKRDTDYWMWETPGDGFKPLYRIKCVERTVPVVGGITFKGASDPFRGFSKTPTWFEDMERANG